MEHLRRNGASEVFFRRFGGPGETELLKCFLGDLEGKLDISGALREHLRREGASEVLFERF